MLKLISMIGSVIDKAQKDHVTAFSAQAAFFTILSFFPFMIVLLSLTRYFPITPNDMIELVRTYLPPKYSGMVVPIIRSLNGNLLLRICRSQFLHYCGLHPKGSYP
mgnify:FL=1